MIVDVLQYLRLVGFMTLVGAGVGTINTGCTWTGSSAPFEPDASAGKLWFTDVTGAVGLGAFRHETGAAGDTWFPETMGSGVAFFDYNGDGWQDLLLVGGGTWDQAKEVQALWLYHNNGDGTFTEVTEKAGLGEVSTYGFGIAAADYDNDGDQDFYLTTLYENKLFRNDRGEFTEVGRSAGVAGDTTWSTAALFFDADRDGWLDLFAGNYVDWSPEEDVWCSLTGEDKGYCTPEVYQGVSPRFYHNNGDGTFTDRTVASGFTGVPGNALGAVELDFNDDGWPDLAVANDLQRNLLFENRGDGTFVERGLMSGIAFDQNGRARAGMGITAGDVENSGHITLFVGNFSNEMIGVFRHESGGMFMDRAAVSRIGRPSLPTLTFGLLLFDADLDGYLDLFAANGHVQTDIERVQDGVTYRQVSQLFMNQADGTFEEVNPERMGAISQKLVARGAAYADYDRDGDLDVVLTENGGSVHLWRNDLRSGRLPETSVNEGMVVIQNEVRGATSEGTHMLRIRLQVRGANRDGAGARLVVRAGDLRMERRIRTGASYLSQSELAATFGLGHRAAVDSLYVFWPDGETTILNSLMADQEIVINKSSDIGDLITENDEER